MSKQSTLEPIQLQQGYEFADQKNMGILHPELE
jgi:hypothetical protein